MFTFSNYRSLTHITHDSKRTVCGRDCSGWLTDREGMTQIDKKCPRCGDEATFEAHKQQLREEYLKEDAERTARMIASRQLFADAVASSYQVAMRLDETLSAAGFIVEEKQTKPAGFAMKIRAAEGGFKFTVHIGCSVG